MARSQYVPSLWWKGWYSESGQTGSIHRPLWKLLKFFLAYTMRTLFSCWRARSRIFIEANKSNFSSSELISWWDLLVLCIRETSIIHCANRRNNWYMRLCKKDERFMWIKFGVMKIGSHKALKKNYLKTKWNRKNVSERFMKVLACQSILCEHMSFNYTDSFYCLFTTMISNNDATIFLFIIFFISYLLIYPITFCVCVCSMFILYSNVLIFITNRDIKY